MGNAVGEVFELVVAKEGTTIRVIRGTMNRETWERFGFEEMEERVEYWIREEWEERKRKKEMRRRTTERAQGGSERW